MALLRWKQLTIGGLEGAALLLVLSLLFEEY